MATAATIAAKLILTADQFHSALAKAGAAAKGFGTNMANIGSSLASTGKLMTLGLTLPLIGVGVAAGNAAKEFDVQMRNIQSISKQTDAQIAMLGDTFLEMSTDLNVTRDSATKLAEAFYFIQSSGFAGEDGMEVLRVATKAASAGLTDTMVAGNAILATLNAYGLEASDAAHVSDVLFKTVDLGVLTFEDLASQLGDVVSTASTMNVGIEEVGGAIALLTRKGISAPEAVTALNQLMLQFISPSQKMMDAADELGVSLDMDTLRTMGLQGALKYLVEKSGDPDVFLKLFGDNVRALKGALALGGDGVTEFSSIMQEFGDVAGRTEEAFAIQNKSFAAQMDNFKNKGTAALIGLGQILLPLLIQFLDKIMPIIDGMKTANPEWAKWAVGIGLVVAVLGPLLMLVGGIITAVGTIGTAVAAVGLPVLLVIAAIIAAIALVYLAWQNNWGGIQEKFAAFWAWLQPILQQVWDWLSVNVPLALETLKGIWVTVVTALSNVWTNVLWPAIQAVWGWLSTVLFPFLQAIANFFMASWGVQLRAFAGLWQNVLLPAIKPVYDWLKNYVMWAFNNLATLWNTVVGPVVKQIGQWIQNYVVWAFNNLTNILKTVTTWLNSVATYLNSLTLPWWLTPGSPTPLQLGLQGVADTLAMISGTNLPMFQAAVSTIPQPLSRTGAAPSAPSPASTNSGGNSGGFDYDRLAMLLAAEVAKSRRPG